MSNLQVGVLAMQGAFREHKQAFSRLGAQVQEVRLPEHLRGLAGVIIPGGESTTMAKLIKHYGFDQALPDFYARGGAIWGTCAGAITIARDIVGYPEQFRLNLLDISVARNAYGRQVSSFETDVAMQPFTDPFRAIFIRAPRIEAVGEGATVLAEHAGYPIMVAAERLLATVFHPELTGDDRIHSYFLEHSITAQS